MTQRLSWRKSQKSSRLLLSTLGKERSRLWMLSFRDSLNSSFKNIISKQNTQVVGEQAVELRQLTLVLDYRVFFLPQVNFHFKTICYICDCNSIVFWKWFPSRIFLIWDGLFCYYLNKRRMTTVQRRWILTLQLASILLLNFPELSMLAVCMWHACRKLSLRKAPWSKAKRDSVCHILTIKLTTF